MELLEIRTKQGAVVTKVQEFKYSTWGPLRFFFSQHVIFLAKSLEALLCIDASEQFIPLSIPGSVRLNGKCHLQVSPQMIPGV